MPTGTLSGGIYGYGRYGSAMYGVGEVDIPESISLSEQLSGKIFSYERTKIFIYGNMDNRGIPIISRIDQNTPSIKTTNIDAPRISKSTPYYVPFTS